MNRGSDFWSRRKARVEAEAQAERARDEAEETARAQAALEDRPDEEILEELGLPDPDSLAKGDDFSAFLAREVPERLKQRALRKLWRSNPVLACVDGLNDYDDDYTKPALVGSAVKTAYKVGSGFAKRALDLVPETIEAETPESDATAPMVTLDTAAPAAQEGATETAKPESAEIAEAQDDAPRPRRRMRFAFEGEG